MIVREATHANKSRSPQRPWWLFKSPRSLTERPSFLRVYRYLFCIACTHYRCRIRSSSHAVRTSGYSEPLLVLPADYLCRCYHYVTRVETVSRVLALLVYVRTYIYIYPRVCYSPVFISRRDQRTSISRSCNKDSGFLLPTRGSRCRRSSNGLVPVSGRRSQVAHTLHRVSATKTHD